MHSMDQFLHEYAMRSILPHLHTSGSTIQRYVRYALKSAVNSNDSLLAGATDTKGAEGSSGDYYFITSASGAQRLLNDSESVADAAAGISSSSAELMPGQLAYNESGDSPSVLVLSSLTGTMKNIGNLATTTAAAAVASVAGSIADFGDGDGDVDVSGFGDFNITGIICDDSVQNSTDDVSALSTVYFKTAVYLMYIPIFIFALLGNGTVCYIVQSTPRMRTVTNYFIANLAVGDILMSLFCVPFSFVSIFILNHWPFGTVLCNLVNYSQAVSVLVSAYTLVAISIDRYIAIMWPLRPRITKRLAKFIIAGVWFIALATALPILIVSKLSQPERWFVECQRYICREEWPSNEQNYYYTLVLLTLQFLVPLTVLVFTYTRIACAVWGKRPPGEAENSRDQRMARSKRKVMLQSSAGGTY
ncbi:RYamide receptor-like [Anastrepha obliqua]|uniref:RYamide receptor-like n=1 Tax=Anastrepha obliqua TaxID=95512 RepID=UPI002409CC7D|nr:RYamide receptor-like [Anastrepha obliqua]